RRRFIVGAALIAAAVSYLVYAGIRTTSMYYFELGEFVARRDGLVGETLRVKGWVRQGSVRWDAHTNELAFELATKDGGSPVPVAYRGIRPDMFSEGRGGRRRAAGALRGHARGQRPRRLCGRRLRRRPPARVRGQRPPPARAPGPVGRARRLRRVRAGRDRDRHPPARAPPPRLHARVRGGLLLEHAPHAVHGRRAVGRAEGVAPLLEPPADPLHDRRAGAEPRAEPRPHAVRDRD